MRILTLFLFFLMAVFASEEDVLTKQTLVEENKKAKPPTHKCYHPGTKCLIGLCERCCSHKTELGTCNEKECKCL